jgi:hypothetical protein
MGSVESDLSLQPLHDLLVPRREPGAHILNYASNSFLRHLPIVCVLTLAGRTPDDRLAVRSLFHRRR